MLLIKALSQPMMVSVVTRMATRMATRMCESTRTREQVRGMAARAQDLRAQKRTKSETNVSVRLPLRTSVTSVDALINRSASKHRVALEILKKR